jgi:hypothetical protein
LIRSSATSNAITATVTLVGVGEFDVDRQGTLKKR